MKKLLIIGLLIILALVIKLGVSYTNTINQRDNLKVKVDSLTIKLDASLDSTTSQNIIYSYNYQACLLYLMYSEDLLLKPYSELTGQSLVYFGHAVKKNESFPNPNYRKAFDLLQVDFCKCIDEAVRLGFDRNNNQQLAVAVMTYNMKASSVREIIQDSLLTNIHKYVWYHKQQGDTTIKCTSPNLENNRAFEKALYFEDGIIDFNMYLP